jgi:hypothetical protein
MSNGNSREVLKLGVCGTSLGRRNKKTGLEAARLRLLIAPIHSQSWRSRQYGIGRIR